MRITFTIPGEPQGKARSRSTARIMGKGEDAKAVATVYSDPAMEASEREIARLYRIAARGFRPISGPIRINLLCVFAIPSGFTRKMQQAALEGRIWHRGTPDLDNIEKLICDALNRVAWADDGQIAVVTKGKRYGDPARVEVTIEALPVEDATTTPGQKRLEKRVAEEGWDAVLAPAPKRANASKTKTGDRMSREELEKIRGTVKFKPGVLFGRRGR